MRKVLLGFFIAGLLVPAVWAKSALDLMLEGRYGEAKAILDKTVASPRYQLMYFALTESEAARACSLYQVIAIRYPNTDCDSVARARLDMAREMGLTLVPISEWANAPAGVKPLGARRAAPPPPPAPTIAAAPSATATKAVEDTIAQKPVAIAIPDTAHSAPPEIARATPVEKNMDLTVEFPKAEKPDTVNPATAPPAKAPEVVPAPPKVEKRDTLTPTSPIVSKPTEVVWVKPKPVASDTVIIPEPETPPVAKTESPAVATPKVAPPVEVTKPVVKEPEVATPAPVTPPSPPVVIKAAPPESLKSVNAETAKPKSDSLAAKPEVKITKPLLTPHDKPMTSPGQWFIQVGAFANFDNAHRLATTLQKAGYPIKLVPRETSSTKLLQVRVGGYLKRDDCTPVADELKSKYQVPAVIISE